MPHVHVTITGKHTREWKQDLMDFAALPFTPIPARP